MKKCKSVCNSSERITVMLIGLHVIYNVLYCYVQVIDLQNYIAVGLLCCAVLCCAVLYCAALYCAALYCAVLYCAAL